MLLGLQDVRKGMADFARFRAMMAGLLLEIKARGEPQPNDMSVAAHLLRIRDAKGQPLPDDRLAAEIGVFFTGGFETTGHTIGEPMDPRAARCACTIPDQARHKQRSCWLLPGLLCMQWHKCFERIPSDRALIEGTGSKYCTAPVEVLCS